MKVYKNYKDQILFLKMLLKIKKSAMRGHFSLKEIAIIHQVAPMKNY